MNLGTKWILGSNLEIFLWEQSNKIFGIREIFEIFLGNMGTQTPWGASLLCFAVETSEGVVFGKHFLCYMIMMQRKLVGKVMHKERLPNINDDW